MAIEIEKKYRITAEQRSAVIESLREFEAKYIREDHEENIIYGGGALALQNAVLRIRITQDRSLLTYKRRVDGRSEAKQQIEFETEISDVADLKEIVANLGFEPTLVYEKRRRIWKFKSAEVVIDELPFGLFMEIEGSLTAITEVEMLLDLGQFETEHETYPRLTARFGKRDGNVIESRFAMDK